MLFEWNDRKDNANQRKHGLSFSDVRSLFDDPRIRSFYDEDHSRFGEDRWISLGRTALGIVCVVVHTVDESGEEELIRLISARVATPNEELQYYSG